MLALKPSAHACDEALNPLDPAFLLDPYPSYRALREAGPIHWSRAFFEGAWLLGRHSDVQTILRDDTRFSARRTGGWVMGGHDQARGELIDFQRLFARAMLFLDAPDHNRLRTVMNAGFGPALITGMRPLAGQWLTERLDTLEASSGFDFIAQIARPLPAYVMAKVMGIDEREQEHFVALSDTLAEFISAPSPSLEQTKAARASLLAMTRSFIPLLEAKRAQPDTSLASLLVQAQAHGQVQAGAELLAQCAMLLFAGHETTRHFLGNALHALLHQPSAWQALLTHPERLPAAVRELLRFDSPVQYTARRVKTDLLLHGQHLKRGDLVIALIGSANRDERVYEAPDALNFTRPPKPPLSFGTGAHVCIGATLTLMETELVLAQLLKRWPRLQATPNGATRNHNPLYRGWQQLHVSA